MYAIYARVSTEEQAKSGFSISSQIREAKKKIGNEPYKEYLDEGVSGEILDRPALSQLRRDVKEGFITKIICYDPDRLSRKLMNQLIITDEFDKRGVELIFISGEYQKTPEGNLFYSMRGAIAEFEKAKINERMSRGRREKAKQGRVLRDFKIYGYNFDKDTEQIVINENEAEIVKLIFDLFTTPNDIVKGINGIAKYLTDKNVPTKRNASVWHRQVVRQILLNQVYTGVFYQNRWNTEGILHNKHKAKEDRIPMRERPKDEWIALDCPPLISKEQYEYAQKLIGESRRRFAKEGLNKYLLSGIVRCGECGNTMTGRKSKNWGKDQFQYTDEKNNMGAKNKGCRMRISCEKLDSHVWDTVSAWLNQPDEIAAASAMEETRSNESFEQAEKARLEKELEKVKAGRKRLIKLFANVEDGIGEEDIRAELHEMKQKEERLTQQLDDLNQMMSSFEKETFSINLIKEAAEYYLTKNPDDLTFEDKQELIRQVVREVRCFDDRIEIYTF